MTRKISLPGLVLGAMTAVIASLLVSHYSLAWLLIGIAAGTVVGAALTRSATDEKAETVRWTREERRTP